MSDRKLPSWYPDWVDLKATNYMRPSGLVVLGVIAVLVLLKAGWRPALVLVAFGAISWFTVGKRKTP